MGRWDDQDSDLTPCVIRPPQLAGPVRKAPPFLIYKSNRLSNRGAIGSFWSGHKLHATIQIRHNATIFRAANHMPYALTSDDRHQASRSCRTDGAVTDNKWFFTLHTQLYYVIDRDVVDIDLKSAQIKMDGGRTKRNGRADLRKSARKHH
jgi:hypothetical protein